MERFFSMQTVIKKGRMAIVVSDKMDVKTKSVTRDKDIK